jgi:ribosomal protein S18 acetylase RimI-like enzyme
MAVREGSSAGEPPVGIRPFLAADAEACFRIRAEAFVRLFYDEMGAEAVAAGINAYMPSDLVRMAEKMDVFVATSAGQVVGFCAVRMLDGATAEILFLYVALAAQGRGIGSGLARYVETWVAEQYPDVRGLELDTGVPGYNAAFWETLGFSEIGESALFYPDRRAAAVRFGKQMPGA